MRRIRFAVEGLGWVAVGVVALAAASVARPALVCRLLGHVPGRYSWLTAGTEQAVCRYCQTEIVRERTDGALAA